MPFENDTRFIYKFFWFPFYDIEKRRWFWLERRYVQQCFVNELWQDYKVIL